MPIRFSLNHTEVGYLVAHPNYVKNLLSKRAPTVFSSGMFVDFGQHQNKYGYLYRPMFQNHEEALIYQLIHSKDESLRNGICIFEMKVEPMYLNTRKTPHHIQFELQHDELERVKSNFKSTNGLQPAAFSESLASRLHKTCTLAIEPVEPMKLTLSGKGAITKWMINEGLSTLIHPADKQENIVSRPEFKLK